MSAGSGASGVKAGEAYVAIGVDLGPLQAGLRRMQTAVAGAGGALQGIGVKMGMAAAAMAAPIYKSIGAFAEQEQAEARLNAILKATGRDAAGTSATIVELAGAMQKTTTFSDDSVISAGAMLAKFKELDSTQFPNLIEASADLATVMGTDLPSAANTIGRALVYPEQGLSRLSRAGIMFSEEEKDTVKAMVAVNDVAGARGVIMNKLAQSTSGAAAAIGKTFTGQIQIAIGLLGELFEAIGSVLAPELAKLSGYITANIDAMVGWVKENKTLILVFAGTAAALAILGPLAVILGTALAGVAAGLGVVATVVGAVVSPIGLIITAIAAAAYALVDWGALWKRVMGGALDGISSFSGAAEIMWAQIKVLWAKGIDYISGAWDGLTTGLSSVIITMQTMWSKFAFFISSSISKAMDFVVNAWTGAGNWITEQIIKITARLEGVDPEDAIAADRASRGDGGAATRKAAMVKAKAEQDAELKVLTDAQAGLTSDAEDRAEERANAVAEAEARVAQLRGEILRKELLDMVKSTEALAAPTASGVPSTAGGGVPFGTTAMAFAGSLGTFSGELAGKTGFTKTEAIDKKQLDQLNAIASYTRKTSEDIGDIGGLE
jgi:hypothetical protein